MHRIFGKVISESSSLHETLPTPFLYYVNGNDDFGLRVIVTDFRSNTFEAVKSRQQLEDLRDDIGIGGSWPEFVEYIMTSFKSGDVKLTLEGLAESGGALRAKLISQKAKGMPRISLSLSKLVTGAAAEAMAMLSLKLFEEFNDVGTSLLKEKESNVQLTKVVADQQEKNVNLQKQLDMVFYSGKHKSQKTSDAEKRDSHLTDKNGTRSPSSTKVGNRVVPAHRRSRVRGVVLNDTEDDPNT